MKLLLSDIYSRRELIERLLQKEFSSKFSFKLKLLKKACSEFLVMLEDQRVELIKKHGTQNDAGYEIDRNNAESFNKFMDEFNEALNQEVDVSVPEFLLEELVADESIKISGNDINLFEIFCKKEEGTNENS